MMKRCTNCHETIRANARKCQLCGYRFDVTPARWPARAGVLAATLAGSGGTLALAISPLAALPALALGGVLGALALAGARANRRRRFRASGAVPALRPSYCCPACSPA